MSTFPIRCLDTSRLYPTFGWNKKKNEPFIRINMRGMTDQVKAYFGDTETLDEYNNHLYVVPLKEPGIHPKSIDQTKPSVFCRVPDRETSNVIKFIDNMVKEFVETSELKHANDFREAKFKPLLKIREDSSEDDLGAVSVKLNTANCNIVLQTLRDGGDVNNPSDWVSSSSPGSVSDIVPGEVHSLLMSVAFSNIVIGSNTYGPKIWGNVIIVRKKPASIITMGGVTIRDGVVIELETPTRVDKRQRDEDDSLCENNDDDDDDEVMQRSKRSKKSRVVEDDVQDPLPSVDTDEHVSTDDVSHVVDDEDGHVETDEEEPPKPRKKERNPKKERRSRKDTAE